MTNENVKSESKSTITLWNVNGTQISFVETSERVNCIAISSSTEGLNVNAIIGGMDSGAIMIWSSWDLTPVRKVYDSNSPILSIIVSSDNTMFLTGNQKGEIVAWGKKYIEKEKKKMTTSILPVNVIPWQSK